MLRVSRHQFVSMARVEFLKRIEELVRINMGEEGARYKLGAIAEHCVCVAEGYGVVTERAIAAFVLHIVRINPQFYLQSRMQTILLDKSVDDQTRAERLLTDTAESDWVEAAAMCDPVAYWERFLRSA